MKYTKENEEAYLKLYRKIKNDFHKTRLSKEVFLELTPYEVDKICEALQYTAESIYWSMESGR